MRYLAPIPLQFVDESGVPCNGGTVSVHYAGHNTLAPIYENSYNDELVDNPVVLDSFGMWKAYVDAGVPLDYIVMNDEGNVVASFLGVVAAGGNGGGTGGVTKAYVDENDNEIRASVGNLAADVADEVDRAEAAEKAAKTEVVGGENVTVEETLAPDGHSIFEVSSSGAPQQQSNWAQQDPSEPDYIKNKPSIPADKVFIFRDNEFNRTLVKAAWDAHKVVQMWLGTPAFRTTLTKIETPDADTEVYHFTAIVPVNRNQSTLNPTWRVFDAQFIYSISTGTYSSGGDSKDIVSPVQSDWNQSDTTALDYIKNKPDLGLKADKVQGATAGNLAALNANGNLTDSGSKVADFKTTQTPVADPSASGTGLEFIDSVTQNANGEITPHKKSVQDGTTAQKGVVKLSNAIDSTSVTEAATPKAVKDAYDELNNKIVARAVFLSQAEWAVQSQLPGDPAKVYYVENGSGEDAYTVYVWKESTSTYEEVDESSIDLDGYWHDSPNTTGNGNVVTGITLGNDGVPVLEKGITALTQHQDISGKADKVSNATNGDLAALDASGNLTDSGKKAEDFAVRSVYNETDPRNLRSFIKCEGSGTQFYRKLATTLSINNNGNSSVIKLEGCVGAWGAADTTDFSIVVRTRGIVLFEASVFKRIGSNNAFDKVNFELYEESDGTYSLWLNSSAAYTKCAISAFAYGGAYIVYDGTNGTPTGTLVASASQNYKVMMVTDGDGSKVTVTPDGTSTGYDLGSSTTLKVWAQKFKNLVSALKALAFKTTVGTGDIDDDAITAAKVKDNETLPVNVSGSAGYIQYNNTNEINFKNVPTTGNKNRNWFNFSNGDDATDTTNTIRSYWFGDRSNNIFGASNTILMSGGISNISFNSSTSVTNWPDGRTGYGCCCTRIDYNVANNRRRVVLIRFIINSASDDALMAFVDLEFKVRIGDWHPMATVVSRPTTGHYNIGQLYWKYSESSGVGSAWIGIETEYPKSIVTPIILGFDGEMDNDHTTLDVKFGDFNSELRSGNWSITPVRKLAYFNMDLGKVGDASTPVYVDTDGSVKECGFQVNFGTPIAGTNILNIVT